MEAQDATTPGITTPAASAAPAPILLDTLFLVLLRLVYFLLSRRFLLVTLNPALRDLSGPEQLLPSTSSQPTPDARLRDTNAGIVPMTASDLDADSDDLLTAQASPASSYPSSPALGRLALAPEGDSSLLRVNDSSVSLPSKPDTDGIELDSLGQRLKEVGGDMRRKVVLQLRHGKGSAPSKGLKKATRGLNRVARVLFSLCIAEACNLLTLVILHSLGILHARARHLNFSASLHILLAMILLVVPLEQCLLLTYRTRESVSAPTRSLSMSSRLLIALIPFSLYVFLFTRIPPYITTMKPEPMDPVDPVETDASWESSREGWEQGGWLASSMGRVVVLGVLILGSLSGFGAVRTAWTFCEHLLTGGTRSLNENDILDAERSLYRVRHEIVGKREEIARESTSAPASDRSWMGRFFSGGEMASLETELRGLQGMEKQASRHVRMLKLRKRRQDFGKTLRGKVYNVLGYVFAAYCAARLVMCLPSIFFSTSQIPVDDEGGRGNSNGDWISFLLALAVTRLPTDFDVDIAVWSRMISLILTGVLILSSLAQVLRSLTRMLRLTSKTVGAGFLLLSLGQLFATYVISLLVQLRTSLPPSPELDTDPFSPFYSNSTLDASGEIFASSPHGLDTPLLASLPDFRVFGRLFDVTFLLAAVATGVYRFFALKVNGDEFAR